MTSCHYHCSKKEFKFWNSNGFEQSVPIGFLTSDIKNSPIPDISTEEGKKQINALLDGVGLFVLDNLSTLVRRGEKMRQKHGCLSANGFCS